MFKGLFFCFSFCYNFFKGWCIKLQKDNIILLSLLGVVVLLFIICGVFAFKKEETILETVTDASKFKMEYESLNGQINDKTKTEYKTVNISENNKFVYKNEEEIIKILESKSGVIYFGFKSCPWCRSMVEALDKASQNSKVANIYYLDIENIRDVLALDENNKVVTEKEGNSNYYKLLNLLDAYLDDYVLKSEEDVSVKTDEKRLYAPTVIAVSNGEIVGFHTKTVDSQTDPNEPLTEEQEKELKKIYTDLIVKTTENICNEGC